MSVLRASSGANIIQILVKSVSMVPKASLKKKLEGCFFFSSRKHAICLGAHFREFLKGF